MLTLQALLTYNMALKAYNITFHYIQNFTPHLTCHVISPTSMGWFSTNRKKYVSDINLKSWFKKNRTCSSEDCHNEPDKENETEL